MRFVAMVSALRQQILVTQHRREPRQRRTASRHEGRITRCSPKPVGRNNVPIELPRYSNERTASRAMPVLLEVPRGANVPLLPRLALNVGDVEGPITRCSGALRTRLPPLPLAAPRPEIPSGPYLRLWSDTLSPSQPQDLPAYHRSSPSALPARQSLPWPAATLPSRAFGNHTAPLPCEGSNRRVRSAP